MGGDGGGDGQGQFARLAFDRVVQQFRMVIDEAGIELPAAEIRIFEIQNFRDFSEFFESF